MAATQNNNNFNNGKRNFFIWILVFVVILIASNLMNSSDSSNKISFTKFLHDAENGGITAVDIRGSEITIYQKDGEKFSIISPYYPNLVERLEKAGVEVRAVPLETKSSKFFSFIIWMLPTILIIVFWGFLMRKGGGGGAMGFGKSRAKLLNEDKTKATFADVAGIDEAKDELQEIVDFLKDPKKYSQLGGKIPRGCLLVGSPGTGKTLLAKAVAGEAGVPFFSISGSDFVEMFVGVGASRVRDMFAQGKKNAPCIIFIDEIDAVGRKRGASISGGHEEREQTLNQLLVEMDGFDENEGVIIIAATNRVDVLDNALTRPGRFDRQVTVPNPDIIGRTKILEVHAKKVKTAPDIDLSVIARGTPGFAGADLANLVNEAALFAARKDKKFVTMKDFEEAKDKIMMGAERRSMVMSDEEKKLTAFHEAGHAIVSLNCKASDPIHKATIIPRGRALGMVMRLPEKDRFSVTRQKLHDDIKVAMGGRAAEEIIFGHENVTTGAESDIYHATQLAKNMVIRWGLSDNVGNIFYDKDEEERYFGSSSPRAEEMQKLIDSEVKKIVDDGFEGAKKILNENIDHLHNLANALIRYETLSGDEIKTIISGKEIRKSDEGVRNSSFLPPDPPTQSKSDLPSEDFA